MLQSTVKRLSVLNIRLFTTLCNEGHRFFEAEQMHQIDKFGSNILEPAGRNTATALAFADLLSDDDDIVRFEDLYGR
jgi:mannose-1-phosphate guanylyltransferase